MKVLLAPVHIGNQLKIYETVLKINGVKATSMALYNNRFKNKASINLDMGVKNKYLNLTIRILFFIYSLFYFDIFHFFYGESLLPKNFDLYFLKLFKKKILMQFWGSDVRIPSIAKDRSKYYINSYDESGKRNIVKMKKLSKFINNIAVQDYELHEYVKPYYKNIFILKACSLNDILNGYNKILGYKKNKRKIRILHIPSQKAFKGSEIIYNNILKLRKRYKNKFEYKLVENTPHNKVKEEIEKSDILIDQIRIGTYGIVSVEAFSLGVPVVCYIRKDLIERYPRELPIINANPDNLYSVLEKLLKNPYALQRYSKKSKEYFMKYHSPDVIGNQLINIYKKL